jgi:hypothetical protein
MLLVIMLSVVVLGVAFFIVVLNVIMLGAIMVGVAFFIVIMLSVVVPVSALASYFKCVWTKTGKRIFKARLRLVDGMIIQSTS